MSDVKFSVAISVYKNDNADYFARALESITVEQSVKPDEIVLIVDGPVSDKINSIIERYEHGEIDLNVIRLQDNKGLGNALRLAVEKARNEIIARMDSDDISLPNRFESELKVLINNPSVDIVGGDITEFIGREDNIVAKRSVPRSDDKIKEYMKSRCPLNHVSVMYKKSAVLKSGNYLDLFWNEDYYLWIRMAEVGCKMANTGEVAVNVRTGEEMYKRRGGIRYFKSELFIQKYMYDRKIINLYTFLLNVAKRFIVEIALPPSIRGFVIRAFARSR